MLKRKEGPLGHVVPNTALIISFLYKEGHGMRRAIIDERVEIRLMAESGQLADPDKAFHCG